MIVKFVQKWNFATPLQLGMKDDSFVIKSESQIS